jgi:hypothetical protein
MMSDPYNHRRDVGASGINELDVRCGLNNGAATDVAGRPIWAQKPELIE